jgi:hypothetical protein
MCETSGKRGYRSKADARVARSRQRGYAGLRVYRCSGCGGWHLGHLAVEVIEGAVSRAERYARGG